MENNGVEGKAAQQPIPEPMGIRIIGDVDPRTLTREEFLASPNLLYHGCAKQFTFSPVYDYSSPEYFTNNDGSETLGEGFYTTADREAAENYSTVRRSAQDIQPLALEVLPFQAKILDLRSQSNSWENAPVPAELFDKWFNYFKVYYTNTEARRNLPWYIIGSEAGYFQYLIRAKALSSIDLRVMLETAPHPQLKGRNLPSPPWMKMFSNFMRQEGYDGLVYVEGGEGGKRKNHTTYVFYNLSKIGTYDSWKSSE